MDNTTKYEFTIAFKEGGLTLRKSGTFQDLHKEILGEFTEDGFNSISRILAKKIKYI